MQVKPGDGQDADADGGEAPEETGEGRGEEAAEEQQAVDEAMAMGLGEVDDLGGLELGSLGGFGLWDSLVAFDFNKQPGVLDALAAAAEDPGAEGQAQGGDQTQPTQASAHFSQPSAHAPFV